MSLTKQLRYSKLLPHSVAVCGELQSLFVKLLGEVAQLEPLTFRVRIIYSIEKLNVVLLRVEHRHVMFGRGCTKSEGTQNPQHFNYNELTAKRGNKFSSSQQGEHKTHSSLRLASIRELSFYILSGIQQKPTALYICRFCVLLRAKPTLFDMGSQRRKKFRPFQ